VYPRVRLHPGREKSLHFRHPWLFSRAVAHVPENLANGSLVSVEDAGGKVMVTGYYNGKSQIALRILSFDETAIDETFFVKKFEEKLASRQRFLDFTSTDAYRLVFSESDGLPGLIVDRYGDFVVVQMHTLGMDLLKPLVVSALVKVLKPKGIYERSDLDVRKKEGLFTMPKGVLYGEEPPSQLEIREHGLKFVVDIPNGQKTGFFLDQRENRLALRKYVEGKTVLNLFSYSGGFSVSALKGGAEKVTCVDISKDALELARKNFSLNGFDPSAHRFETRDVFDFLDAEAREGQRYDVIVVDPPAFVKNRDSLNHGINAYIKLNHKALELLSDDGILVSSSCSSHVTTEMFRTVLFKAALQAGREMVLLEQKIQPPDHPLNINFPEGEYLKFFVCSARKI
jgi:23S rRNA (cytosine1962-C5)-methyltransferase